MFLIYVDESGNRDPRLEIPQKDGTTKPGEWLYSLTAVSLFEHQWHGFEKTLNRQKQALMSRINRDTRLRLDLADCEIKSNWVRTPKERANRPFLANLHDDEMTELLDLYFRQLDHHKMHILSVIIDKRHLHDYMDQEKIHRKSWELLLELVEQMMRLKFPKHQALMVNDDVTKEVNRSLAMKHAFLLDQGTRSDMWLSHICEMPMFVRSEFSNGVQLADLCSYSIYRAFRDGDLAYPFFDKIAPAIWSRTLPVSRPFTGIRVFPEHSPLKLLVEEFETKRALTIGQGSE